MTRELGRLLLGVAAGVVTIVAALHWWSWQRLAQADRYIEAVADRGWVEDDKAWHRHYDALDAQLDLVPMNAPVHWRLGELHQWRAAGMHLWPDAQQGELDAARQHYLQAIARSPRNSHWIARAAARLAPVDERLAIALARQALDMAPYEPVVQYHVAEVAFQHWNGLEPETRERIRSMLSHALQRGGSAAGIKRMAKRWRRLDILTQPGDGSG